MTTLTQSAAWQKLAQHTAPQLADLFARDADRTKRYSITDAGLKLDYSRQPIDDAILQSLLELATQEHVNTGRQKLFAGDIVNATEKRAALHWQWRMPEPPIDIAITRNRMLEIAGEIRSGAWLGKTGKPIKHIVNIGIGGSDLGPRLIYDALVPADSQPLQLHFVSNVDTTDLARVTQQCAADETLFVIVSKSMGTLETKLNAEAAKDWLVQELGSDSAIAKHMLAVTTNITEAEKLGIPALNCFGFGNEIGGRYSVWSPVGLAVMIALGPDAYIDLWSGAAAMDAHFQNMPLAQNMPVLLALLSIWQINFNKVTAEAVLPYATRLGQLPNYLQQLVMESNGKSVALDGTAADYATAPVIFGSTGTLGQHSFHQLLHQGTAAISSDFILMTNIQTEADQWLLANGLAQSAALLYGHTDADPHCSYPGNRASNLIMMDQLTPKTLGSLLALYEHKTFVQGLLWRINSFDQFGVELGKTMALATFAALENGPDHAPDAATKAALYNL